MFIKCNSRNYILHLFSYFFENNDSSLTVFITLFFYLFFVYLIHRNCIYARFFNSHWKVSWFMIVCLNSDRIIYKIRLEFANYNLFEVFSKIYQIHIKRAIFWVFVEFFQIFCPFFRTYRPFTFPSCLSLRIT